MAVFLGLFLARLLGLGLFFRQRCGLRCYQVYLQIRQLNAHLDGRVFDVDLHLANAILEKLHRH